MGKTEKARTAPEGFVPGFRHFLHNYGILALAIAVVIGNAVNKLVTAAVTDVIMPIVTFFIPEGRWDQAIWKIGTVQLKVGDFAAAMLDFLIIALFVYFVARWILHTDTVKK